MKKILLVEDEQDLAEVLVDNLEAEGYQVLYARDGQEGLDLWRQEQPALVVLDVMMPKIDGLTLCKMMREEGNHTPVLFLSARGQPEDRVKGLAVGGDDYLTKPFHLPEFLMRLHTMLRRQGWGQEENILTFGQHQIDLNTGHTTLSDGRRLKLTTDERRLLGFLAAHPAQIVTREQLLDELWSDGIYPSTRAIERLIQHLRQHFEPQPEQPRYFHRQTGIRYRFTPEGEEH